MFVPGKRLQPSLVFEGKAMKGASLGWATAYMQTLDSAGNACQGQAL